VTTETTKAVVAARLNVGLVRRVKTRDVDSAKQYKQQLKTWLEEDVKEGQVSPDETGHIGLFHAVESGMGSVDETMTTGSELNATVLALQTLIQRSKKDFGVPVQEVEQHIATLAQLLTPSTLEGAAAAAAAAAAADRKHRPHTTMVEKILKHQLASHDTNSTGHAGMVDYSSRTLQAHAEQTIAVMKKYIATRELHSADTVQLLAFLHRLALSERVQALAKDKYTLEQQDVTQMVMYKKKELAKKRKVLTTAKQDLSKSMYLLGEAESDLVAKKEQLAANTKNMVVGKVEMDSVQRLREYYAAQIQAQNGFMKSHQYVVGAEARRKDRGNFFCFFCFSYFEGFLSIFF
jgi:hypothetical protein